MADEEKDSSQKTEEPSEKRKREAKEKGQIPISKDLSSWFMLTVGSIVLLYVFPKILQNLKGTLTSFFQASHTFSLEKDNTTLILTHTVQNLMKALTIPAVIFLGAALFIGLLQSKANFSTESLKPKLKKISPLKGLKRLFSLNSLVETTKNILKILIIGGAGIYILWPVIKSTPLYLSMSLEQVFNLLRTLALKNFILILSVMFLIALLDYIYQFFKNLNELKMTREEVKEEHKQTEGNPEVKRKLRSIRLNRARTNMMKEVPKATVVITNPTHYAVALQYESSTMDAPKVIAKGQGHIALKIRSIAEEHDIEIVENKPLARTLFEHVEVEEEIPFEYYQAVAEVIRYVFKKRGVTL